MKSDISSIQVLELPYFKDEIGNLVVVEGMTTIPFSINRIFMISAPEGSVRGRHAHKLCSQFLISTRGSVEVLCDDGSTDNIFKLNHPSTGLFIPAGIWAEQKYMTQNASLTVLCDRIYEAEDYIRDYDNFLKYRQKLLAEDNVEGQNI